MNQQNQQTALAEYIGWSNISESKLHGGALWGTFAGLDAPIPDYLNDMNRLKRIVDCLSPLKRAVFRKMLKYIAAPSLILSEGKILREEQEDAWFHASKNQWVEAFLRTIGKWEDGE